MTRATLTPAGLDAATLAAVRRGDRLALLGLLLLVEGRAGRAPCPGCGTPGPHTPDPAGGWRCTCGAGWSCPDSDA